ncbi:MAG: hypothetical protein HQM08_24655 [Candidatus Riflebacteria bacterium]|nr:hypothetical protein [Candidatus Riflebacteria bacterium]
MKGGGIPHGDKSKSNIKTEPGKAGLESIKETAFRINLARKIDLPPDILKGVRPQLLERYVKQTAIERGMVSGGGTQYAVYLFCPFK